MSLPSNVMICSCCMAMAMWTAFARRVALGEEAPLRQRIDRLVQPYLDNDVVVGMTIGVVQNGEASVFGYGKLSADDSRAPDGDTVYEIASITKVFTGLLLADAVVQEHVKLDQPAGDLLPEGVEMPRRGERAITLRDLATHVSGLPRMPDNFAPSDPENPFAYYTVDDLHEFLNDHELRRPPGAKFEYSNVAAGLLGRLLAVERGTDYDGLLRERITGPLEMTSTTIALSDDQRARLAPPHLADGRPTSNWDLATLAGGGGIRSTVNDMVRFIERALDPPDGTLGKAIDLAWQVHQEPLAEGDFAMGLGWHVARDGSTRWHNGQTGGYHSMMLVSRQLDTGVVVLANTATGEIDRLAEDILRMLAGADVEPRTFEKVVEVDAKIIERYVGKYQLRPAAVLTVSVDDGKLMVGLTGQPTFQVYARSDSEWFYKVVDATLTFEVDASGKCTEVELLQNDERHKAPRIE